MLIGISVFEGSANKSRFVTIHQGSSVSHVLVLVVGRARVEKRDKTCFFSENLLILPRRIDHYGRK